MKYVVIEDYDFKIYQFAKQALRAYYIISPLSKDTDFRECYQNNTPDLFLITLTKQDPEPFKTYDSLMRIPEMIGSPVVLIADANDPELEQQALNRGIFDYITLPISPELLLHRISNCLELTALRRERPFIEKYQDAISRSFAELVECRDLSTGGHLKNTTRYFDILLKEAMASEKFKNRIPVEDMRDILRSVTLHDIGKIGINDDILKKASTLDFNEYEFMKTHTTLGSQALDNVIKETGGSKWLSLARDMAYSHHERWDGTGYPNGLKGEEIPLYARMLSVADVYDALTSNRAYKNAFSHQKAMEIIVEGKGSIFDPDMVELFENVSGQFEEVLNMKYESEAVERV